MLESSKLNLWNRFVRFLGFGMFCTTCGGKKEVGDKGWEEHGIGSCSETDWGSYYLCGTCGNKLDSVKIVAAAIKYPEYNDLVVTGLHHAECLSSARMSFGVRRLSKRIDGFLTNRGYFVDRKEAMVIARAAGQIRGVCHLNEEELDSSDYRECNCTRCKERKD